MDTEQYKEHEGHIRNMVLQAEAYHPVDSKMDEHLYP